MNEKLLEYIKVNVERGNDVEKLKEVLLKAGHEIDVVNEHINHVLKHRKAKEFIKKHIGLGSDIGKLKQHLSKAGYDLNIVEEHISEALKYKKNKKRVLITIALVMVLLASVLAFYSFTKMSKTSFEINESRIAEIQYKESLDAFNMALIGKDILGCDKIKDDSLREECRIKFSLNVSNATEKVCDEACIGKGILNDALISKNASLCVEIKDNATRMQCGEILKG